MYSDSNKLAQKAFLISAGILLAMVLIEYFIILYLNDGHFTFALDDPYIHLALAENVIKCHYGVNVNEFSAPSSSILWTFILAPFTIFKHSYYAPFILNIIFLMGALWGISKIVVPNFSEKDDCDKRKLIVYSLLVSSFIFSANMIGLIYGGMEHGLQVFLAVLTVLGIITHIETKSIPYWFQVAIILNPLVRYESLAISAAAIFYLFFVKERKISIILGFITVSVLSLFSLFLLSHGLEILPTSVIAKSLLVNSYSEGFVKILFKNLATALTSDRGIILSCSALIVLYQAFLSERKYEERIFAISMIIAVILHLFFGAYGWLYRYEIYVWISIVLTTLFFWKKNVLNVIQQRYMNNFIVIVSVTVFILSYPYIRLLGRIPLGANDIYMQQYQMHRFATEFYKKPVGVNDLGYVSYQNDNYILDLNGLASLEALKFRSLGAPCEWMNQLSEQMQVRFAMIYDSWFKERPRKWIKVAELDLGRSAVTVADRNVTFYALDRETAQEVYGYLEDFKESLPKDVKFRIFNQ
ncbi:putative membrane protein of unknown function [Chloroherpeton thalassium ATCC 35110]|uniref:Glycosyltransferase RgtA/B/C/D-like domain-containing protein n=1 Tax=Chloroherpeton thalassium (strain ATCC 35110 / GB-78) TaxID=517418 RepID=B3QT73_CHLT3|nr:hypothetical protein [Chloroherpeton thalassium]ACF14172.1 putative membrane protein of unknown function [Chloroherpeton thalassium ATCC 35110]